MTTRANAYAYIRNIKRIAVPTGNDSSCRTLSRNVSRNASFLRLQRDLHTARGTSTPVDIGNKTVAGSGDTAGLNGRTACASSSISGRRRVSTPRPTTSRSITGASLLDESMQKDQTTLPGEGTAPVSAEKDESQESISADNCSFLTNSYSAPYSVRAEYSLFMLLINQKALEFEEKNIKVDEKKDLFRCTVSLPIDETNVFSESVVARGQYAAFNDTLYSLFYNKLWPDDTWQILQSDASVKQALRNMLPSMDDAVTPIDLGAENYHRFLQMFQEDCFQLGSIRRWIDDQGFVNCFVSLSMPGQPAMKAIGRVNRGVRCQRTAELAARLLLIADLQRSGLWGQMELALETKLKDRNSTTYQPDQEEEIYHEQVASISKNKSLSKGKRSPKDIPVSHEEAITEDQPDQQGEIHHAKPASLSKDQSVLKGKGSPKDIPVSHGDATTEDQPNTESRVSDSHTESTNGKAPLSARGFAELTADDDLLDTMGLFRNDLLRASRTMRTAKARQGPTFGKYASKQLRSFVPLISPMKRSMELKDALDKLRESESPEMIDIRSKVADLPITGFRKSVIELVNDNPFSIIVAETGSGKSTQVPQIILDDAIDRGVGGDCNILCTQPRRLATYRLAERVAQERDETIGGTVGYIFRRGRRVSMRNTHITFCTTGVLLSILQSSLANLRSFSHIIIDEAHVRDIGIDFVMLLLKRYAESCHRKGAEVPKITVMSATMDIDLFASYFSLKGPGGSLIPAPHINIPGRQFHVQHHYLDEIIDDIKESPHAENLLELLKTRDSKEFLENHYTVFGEEDMLNDTENADSSELSIPSARSLEEEDVQTPFGLYSATILHVLTTTTSGSIVCFLPGLRHMLEVKRLLLTHGSEMNLDISNENLFRIGILHSLLPEEQEKLSLELPSGCRRIILSTDIAEASVTLPDVKYVIDSGKVNKMLVDQKKRSSRLAECWATKSNARQRAGRVGRVQAGEYYYMGTKRRYDTLRYTQTPELLRGNLETTCLRAKTFAGKESIATFLQNAVEPPNNSDVIETVDSLKQLGALDRYERMTPLGHILSQLPISPHLGKLVILGIIFRCLEPLLILACSANQTPLFLRSTDPSLRQVIADSRIDFAEGSSSDHISTINAFKAVRRIHYESGYLAAKRYAIDNMIWFRSFESTLHTCQSIFDSLTAERIIPMKYSKPDEQGQIGGPGLNINSHHTTLIKSLLLHCLFPRIAGPKPHSGAFATDYDPRTRLDSTSVVWENRKRKQPPKSLTIYSSKMETSGSMPALVDISLVSPLMASIFGGRLIWDRSEKEMLMDSWLSLDINMEKAVVSKNDAARTLIELQKAVNLALTTAYDTLSPEYPIAPNFKKQRDYHLAREDLYDTLAHSIKDLLQRDRDPSTIQDSSQETAPDRENASDVWETFNFSDDTDLVDSGDSIVNV